MADDGSSTLRCQNLTVNIPLYRTGDFSLPSRPGELHPEPLTDSGREPLDSSGSCPPEKAAAFRQTKEFLRCPVDSSTTWVTCLLRSTRVTSLPRYYEAVRPWPALRYFRPRGASTCAFSLPIASPVLKFRPKANVRVMPPIHPHSQ